jgi:hypothetical protein
VGAASLSHASEKSIYRTAVCVEESPALRGNLVELLGTVTGADRHVAELVKERQRWIDDARTGAIGTADLLFNRFDDFVSVPGLLGDQVEDNQAKVAMSEKSAEAASAALSAVAIMSEVATALAMFFAAIATAVVVMGMSMDHEFSECILT